MNSEARYIRKVLLADIKNNIRNTLENYKLSNDEVLPNDLVEKNCRGFIKIKSYPFTY